MPDETESAQNPTDPGSPEPAPQSQPSSAQDEADALASSALAAAQAAIDALNQEAQGVPMPAAPAPTPPKPQPAPSATPGPQPMPMSFPDLTPASSEPLPKGIDLISDVNVDVTIELGRTRMLVEDVLRLAEGAVVELDKLAGDPVDIYVNKRLVARGEVLVLNDNFCIRVNDILDADLVEQERR